MLDINFFQIWGRGAPMGWALVVSDGASVRSYSSCMIQSNDIAAVLNLIFDCPILGKGCPYGVGFGGVRRDVSEFL